MCWAKYLVLVNTKEAMYRFFGLRVGPNLRMRTAAEKKFAVFTEKYLWPCGCSDSNFMAEVKCINLKTKIESEIIEIEIIQIQI